MKNVGDLPNLSSIIYLLVLFFEEKRTFYKIMTSIFYPSFFFQVKQTFNEHNWWNHHEKYRDRRFRWLPTEEEIPKYLHETALLSHLEELEVRT